MRPFEALITETLQLLSTVKDSGDLEERLLALQQPLPEAERAVLWGLVAEHTPLFTEGMRRHLGALYPLSAHGMLDNPRAQPEDYRGVGEHALSVVRAEIPQGTSVPEHLQLLEELITQRRIPAGEATLSLFRQIVEGGDSRNQLPALRTLLALGQAEESWLLKRLFMESQEGGVWREVARSPSSPVAALRFQLTPAVGSYAIYEELAKNPTARADPECYQSLRQAGRNVWDPVLLHLAREAEGEELLELLRDLLETPRALFALQELLRELPPARLESLPRELRALILSHPDQEVRLQGMRSLPEGEASAERSAPSRGRGR